jgi:hypothetical protein
VDAAIALADVSTHGDDDDAFAARWDQLKMAALRYARAETTAGESSATPNEVAATDEATHRILIVRD